MKSNKNIWFWKQCCIWKTCKCLPFVQVICAFVSTLSTEFLSKWNYSFSCSWTPAFRFTAGIPNFPSWKSKCESWAPCLQPWQSEHLKKVPWLVWRWKAAGLYLALFWIQKKGTTSSLNLELLCYTSSVSFEGGSGWEARGDPDSTAEEIKKTNKQKTNNIDRNTTQLMSKRLLHCSAVLLNCCLKINMYFIVILISLFIYLFTSVTSDVNRYFWINFVLR